MITIKFSAVLDAFQFANSGAPFESSAFVNLDTGAMHCTSNLIDLEEDVPDDLETSDRYIALPHKNDLDLGRDLALLFVEQDLPGDLSTVAGFFRSRGAYSRFKDLLATRDALETWYAFEAQATETALRAWCSEHGIQIGP